MGYQRLHRICSGRFIWHGALCAIPPQAIGKTFTIPMLRLEADRSKIEGQVTAEDGHDMATGGNLVISGAAHMLTSAPLPKPKRS
jgi:hypothetical protein